MPELLEVTAHGVTAVLASWLGLLVATRASRAPGAPTFTALCGLLVAWSLAIIVQRLTGDDSVKPGMNLVEDASAFLLPPVTAHLAMSIAFEGRRPWYGSAVLAVGYSVAVLAILQAAVDPAHEIGFTADSFAVFGLPPGVAGWTYALVRLGVWGAGVGFIVIGLGAVGTDALRRRQLQFAIATLVLGIIGAMLRILPADMGGPRWIGVSLIMVATVMATYAVVAQHLFVSADVVGRAVRWSVLGGLAVVMYVAIIVGLDRAVATALSVELPLVSALAVVVTLALFEPVSNRVQRVTAGSPITLSHQRLMEALGTDPLVAQRPDAAVEPTLARVVRAFDLTGARIVDASGAALAVAGSQADLELEAVRIAIPREDGGQRGHAIFGRRRNGDSLSPADLRAMELAVDYLASSLRLAERQDQQATAISDLREEGMLVESRGSALSEVLADASSAAAPLRVHVLGSLRAERGGEPIRRWGGEKAGSRQAEGLFAFLLDRGERGASKDELIELIWPDVDLDRADVAFHRTMLGLRSMLQPGRRGRKDPAAITFHNDRYRLDPSVVAWSDLAEYDRLVAEAGRTTGEDAERLLEQATALYRGDYLDDCPYYGDSADVEERRSALRSRQVDLLVELAHRHADRGDRPAAAASYREALALADEERPEITDALSRLGAPRSVEAG